MRFFQKKIQFLLLGAAFWAAAVAGQMPQFRAQKLDARPEYSYMMLNMVADPTGMFWLSGLDGLWNYDGGTFEPYRRAKNERGEPVSLARMNQLLFSKHYPNRLWMGSMAAGLYALDITTGRVLSFPHDPTNENSPGGNEITALWESPDGRLWFTSDNFSLTCFDGKNFRRFAPPSVSPSEGGVLGGLTPVFGHSSRIWLGSRFGLYSFDLKTELFEFFPFPQVMPIFYEGYAVFICATSDGSIWAAGSNANLFRLKPNAKTWVGVPLKYEVNKPTRVFSMSLNDDGRLVISHNDPGLWFYDWKNEKFEHFQHIPSGNNSVVILHKQRKPGEPAPTWYLRAAGDIYKLLETPHFVKYRRFKEQNPTIEKNNWQRSYTFSSDKKHLFLGTLRGMGILRRDWQRDTVDLIIPADPNPADPEDQPMLDDLFFDPDGKTLWIGTNLGLMHWQEGWKTARWWVQDGRQQQVWGENASLSHHIDAIFADENQLWLGTLGKGVLVLEKNTGNVRPLFDPESELGKRCKNTLRIFEDSRKNLWLGTTAGMFCVDKNSGEAIEKFAPGNEFGETLQSPRVLDFEEDAKGRIWISTHGGLQRFDPAAPKGNRLAFFKNEDIPLANFVNDLCIAADGKIWLATEDVYSVFDPATEKFANITSRDGVFKRHRMIYELPNGLICGGANGGFMEIDPSKFLAHSAEPPSVYWRDFKVFDRPAEQTEHLYTDSELVLQPDQNYFSFEFGALNFEENAQNKFAYQLEGFDGNWIFSGERTFAGYTNLPPGKYLFKVKAANRHGIWSEPKTIGIRILPPFYRTWWFLTLAFLAACALVYFLFRAWRERRSAMEAKKIIDYFANSSYSGSSVDEILWDVTRNCISRLNFTDCIIYLFDEKGEFLVQKAAHGGKKLEENQILNPLKIAVGRGIVGSVGKTGRAEIVSDTTLDPRYIPDAELGLSEIAVPLIEKGEVIGVIDSEHPRRNFFTGQHLHILQSIANVCAAKIVKAKAEEAIRKKEAELLELEKNLAESQLTALKAQMNPHFLFNCLNSINWYIVKNRPLEASKYLTKFSRLIRLILDNSKHQRVPLASEMDALKLYIEMEGIRFEQKFDYEIEVDDVLDTDELKIAPMILQPYVENAIWHGLMPLGNLRPGHLRVAIGQENGHLLCVVEDNGIGREAARNMSSGGVAGRESKGMRITADRISILNSGENGSDLVRILDLVDENGVAVGTRVELMLPLEN